MNHYYSLHARPTRWTCFRLIGDGQDNFRRGHEIQYIRRITDAGPIKESTRLAGYLLSRAALSRDIIEFSSPAGIYIHEAFSRTVPVVRCRPVPFASLRTRHRSTKSIPREIAPRPFSFRRDASPNNRGGSRENRILEKANKVASKYPRYSSLSLFLRRLLKCTYR